jgi:hypothetical protein
MLTAKQFRSKATEYGKLVKGTHELGAGLRVNAIDGSNPWRNAIPAGPTLASARPRPFAKPPYGLHN